METTAKNVKFVGVAETTQEDESAVDSNRDVVKPSVAETTLKGEAYRSSPKSTSIVSIAPDSGT